MRRLLTTLALLALATGPAAAGPGHEHGHGHGHAHPDPGAKTLQALGAVLPPYETVRAALAKGDAAAAAAAAPALAKAARAHDLGAVADHADKIAGADLQAARAAFAALSAPLAETVLGHTAARKAFRVFDCAAAPGRWIQRGGQPVNPYHDGEQRQCAERVEAGHHPHGEKKGHDHAEKDHPHAEKGHPHGDKAHPHAAKDHPHGEKDQGHREKDHGHRH